MLLTGQLRLTSKDLYDQLISDDYDDSPWTSEERHALAWEPCKHAGWDKMDDVDDLEKP